MLPNNFRRKFFQALQLQVISSEHNYGFITIFIENANLYLNFFFRRGMRIRKTFFYVNGQKSIMVAAKLSEYVCYADMIKTFYLLQISNLQSSSKTLAQTNFFCRKVVH